MRGPKRKFLALHVIISSPETLLRIPRAGLLSPQRDSRRSRLNMSKFNHSNYVYSMMRGLTGEYLSRRAKVLADDYKVPFEAALDAITLGKEIMSAADSDDALIEARTRVFFEHACYLQMNDLAFREATRFERVAERAHLRDGGFFADIKVSEVADADAEFGHIDNNDVDSHIDNDDAYDDAGSDDYDAETRRRNLDDRID